MSAGTESSLIQQGILKIRDDFEKANERTKNKPRDSVLNGAYRYQRDLLEQFDVSAAWPIAKNWQLFARWVYSLAEDKTLDQFVGFEYSSCCWSIRAITRRFVSSRTGSSDTSVGIQLELKGLSSVGVDNQAFLRDAIRGYSPVSSVPGS